MRDLLREYIASILIERGPALTSNVMTNKQIELQLTTASSNLADVSHVSCEKLGSNDGHCRIFLNDLKDKSADDLKKLARAIVKAAFGGNPTVKNVGKVHSGRFDTYETTDAAGKYSYNIVFSGGLTSGQRGGGYEYEGEVKRLLGVAGSTAEEGKTDTTVSDVFLMTGSGNKIGIEVKGAGAKFGQPTLQYDYVLKKFVVPAASRSSNNAKLVVDILNSSKDAGLVAWLNKLRNAWNKLHPDNKMKSLGTQIQPEDWEEMMTRFSVGQSGPNVPMGLQQIVTYYKKKHAQYLQIQGKGLYAFDDVLRLGVTTFVDAAAGLDAFIKPEILMSGGNKVLRASIALNYRTLTNSNMDLAKHADAKKFSTALKNS